MIPKIIHQIWIGPNPIPEKVKGYCELAKSKFSDYEYMFWNNDNIPELPTKCQNQIKKYEKKQKYAFVADILRYYILNEYGGVYLDVDFIVYNNFSELIDKPFFCVNPNYNCYHVCNGVFGCEPNNPILSKLLDELKNEIYHGPLLFSKYISDFIGVPNKTHIKKHLDSNPHNYVQCLKAEDFFRRNSKYCYHEALHTWSNRKKQ